jgi:hypothetical protein
MPRSRQRATLECGLKLDLNRLARRGFIRRGAYMRSGITWTNSYYGEEIALGLITADMSGEFEGWFRIEIGGLSQSIDLTSRPRHFGGRQWYFVCPRSGRNVSVLWRPPGARSFASRQSWGRQVAYLSQFSTWIDRAHQGKQRIKRRLCSIGSFDPDEWEFPPKPKWMRWRTYNRSEDQFDAHEAALDRGTFALIAKFIARYP